jgi:Transposase DDE domain group 1
MTECTQRSLEFHPLGRREVTARFDAPAITSDAGGLLLRELDSRFGFIKQFAQCFDDYRSPKFTVHSLEELLSQRIFGIALGYEDLNDHEDLRHDPLFAVAVGKNDPSPPDGFALAGKSTLNRLELTPVGANQDSRYKKVVARHRDIEDFFVNAFLQVHTKPPKRIVLDLDATDDPLHGHQSGRFFHGYYKCYCYLPLYIFCGSHLLCAKLRPADIDAAAGSVKQLDRIVKQIRAKWPGVEIVIRGDSGFCRENIMSWCESSDVGFVLGLPKNRRLERILGKELHEAKQQFEATGNAARVYKDFSYQTKKSWSRERRVIGKAEHLAKGQNPRFVVTNLSAKAFDAPTLYEKEYCARGDMENRIKEQQLYLFADRTSASTMRANQLRLWLSSVAYVLVNTLREVGLKGTQFAKAQCHTIRLKLFKIGAAIRITVRKVWVSLSTSYPYAETFMRVLDNLQSLPVLRPSPG